VPACVGAGYWDTPMSRHLFEGSQVEAMGQLERCASPTAGGSSGGDGGVAYKQSAEPGNMYMALLRLPLKGVFW